MPIYDYICRACRHRFEAFHGLNETGPHQCPVCGQGPVKRVFAPPTIVFKGSGWAKLDRRYSGSPQRKKEDTGGGSESAAPAATEGGSAGGQVPSGPKDAPAGPPAAPTSD